MLKRNTVFIVGAGASAEFNLPVGEELARRIKRSLTLCEPNRGWLCTDDYIEAAIRSRSKAQGPDRTQLLNGARRISEGLPLHLSIDNFMENHKEEEEIQICGKIAIVRHIAAAEAKSTLASRNALREQPELAKWLRLLFQLMQQGIARSNAHNFFRNSTFIVFNYDRCVEYFFEQALQMAYSLPTGTAREIVNSARFMHPYGTIAPLPWQPTASTFSHEFGVENIDCNTAALNLLTYSEYISDETKETEFYSVYREADVFVFLGFSFLDQNVDLVLPQKFSAEYARSNRQNRKTAIGTAFNIHEYNATLIAGDIQSRLSGIHTAVVNLDRTQTCEELIRNYGRAFA